MYLSTRCTVLAPSRSHTSGVLGKYLIIRLSNTSRSHTSGVLDVSITSATPTQPIGDPPQAAGATQIQAKHSDKLWRSW